MVIPISLHLSSKQKNRQQNTIYLPAHVKIGASGIFQFRYVFPEPLRAIVGKRELKYSLGKDYRQMQEQAWHLNANIKSMLECWHDVRQSKTMEIDANTKDKLKQLILTILRRARDSRDINMLNMAKMMSMYSVKSTVCNIQSMYDMLLNDAKPEDIINAGLTPEFFDRMKLQLMQKKSKRGMTLEKLLDKWIEAKRQSNKSDKSMNAYNTAKAELIWAFGARKEAVNITSDDIREYKTFWLGDVPMLEYRKSKKLTVKSIISGQYDKPEKYLGDKSKINKLLNIRNFFKWAYTEDHLATNFAEKLRDMGFNDEINAVPSLSDEMIGKIYEKSQKYKDRDESKEDRRYRYWVFLIMLYTGARVGEVCQLQVSDILLPGELDPSDLNQSRKLSIPCICFRKNAGRQQSVKNKSSVRAIPIHSRLLERGFLDYVKERKQADKEMLFDVTYTKNNGWGGKVSEYYNEIIRKEFPNAKATLESTRHNVETIFDKIPGGSQEYKISLRITGRTVKEHNQVRRRYVDIYTPEQMQPVVEMIRYEVLGDGSTSENQARLKNKD